MMRTGSQARACSRSGGFGLVEVMVALVVGLIVTLVIMQASRGSRDRRGLIDRRAGTRRAPVRRGVQDGRDVQMAGYGLLPAAESAMECDPVPSIYGRPIAGISIIDGGAAAGGASDTLVIRYGGSSPLGGAPQTINAITGNVLSVDNNYGCAVGDVALLVKGPVCSATRVSGISASPDFTQVTVQSALGGVAGGNLACLGAAWDQVSYAVAGGTLQVNGQARVPGIVNLQAQYGVSDQPSSNQITQWVDATGAWANPTVVNRNRIKAVRVAVIARSVTEERENVSVACSSITDANPTGVCAWDATSAQPVTASPAPLVDLSNDANWQRFRYRVFETIVPLRNTIWSRETL